MPIPVLKAFVKQSGKSLEELERYYKEAKKQAKEEGKENNWAYIVGIVKRRTGLSESINKLSYNEWLSNNQKAKDMAKELSNKARDILDKRYREKFLKNNKHDFDTYFIKKYSEYLKESLLQEDDPIQKIVLVNGIRIDLEWPKGSTRQYKGNNFKRVMKDGYGYIFGTKTKEDNEGIDVYVGDTSSENVYRIKQLKNPKEFPGANPKEFDEYKYMLNYPNKDKAEESYKYHISPEQFGGIDTLSIEDFKDLIKRSIINKNLLKEVLPEEYQSDLRDLKLERKINKMLAGIK